MDSLPAEPQGEPKNTGVRSLSLLQQIFAAQESNRRLLHCRQILYQLSYQGCLILSVLSVKPSWSPLRCTQIPTQGSSEASSQLAQRRSGWEGLGLGSSFTCFHWGVGAERPCSGRQLDGWLTPRSCVSCDTQASVGRDSTWRQKNKKKHTLR